ncbi:MAG: hypothetical protein ACK5PQ_05330 [Alphaproteobacteria bacterium]
MNKLHYLLTASLMALGLSSQAGDFQGHSVEIRAGASIPFGRHDVDADPGAGAAVITDKIATRGPLGFGGIGYIYNMGDVFTRNLDLGVSLGANWFMGGDSVLRMNTPLQAQHYSVTQKTRYELAFRMGADQGKAYPFVKIGAVAGDWETKARAGFGTTSKKDLLWGATVGAGVDLNIHHGGALGFIAEGDWYAGKDYDLALANGAAPYAKIKTNPWAMNFAITYKYKICD